MKINEIVTEGMWDKFKQVGAGVTGGTTGWQTQGTKNATTNKVNKAANIALQKWTEYAHLVQSSTGIPPTDDQAQQWFIKFSGKPASSPPAEDLSNIKDWLTTEIAGYMASKVVEPVAEPSVVSTPIDPTMAKLAPTTAQPTDPAEQARAQHVAQRQTTGLMGRQTPVRPVTTPTASRQRTGGKVAGQVSQTPNAIAQRAARQAAQTKVNPTIK